METIKPIAGYEGLYSISSNGSIISHYSSAVMKQTVTSAGYVIIGLTKNGRQKIFKIHRLIGMHFIPNPLKKPQVNHKDGNKQNNNINNLEWNTTKENVVHAIKNKLKSASSIEHMRNMSDNGVKATREPIEAYCYKTKKYLWTAISFKDAADTHGLTYDCIYRTIAGLQKSHRGMYFKRIKHA